MLSAEFDIKEIPPLHYAIMCLLLTIPLEVQLYSIDHGPHWPLFCPRDRTNPALSVCSINSTFSNMSPIIDWTYWPPVNHIYYIGSTWLSCEVLFWDHWVWDFVGSKWHSLDFSAALHRMKQCPQYGNDPTMVFIFFFLFKVIMTILVESVMNNNAIPLGVLDITYYCSIQ